MKNTLFLLLISSVCFGQIGRAKLDTIPINQFTTTQLIFPEDDNIEIVDVGTGDVMVGHRIIKNVVLLQSSVKENAYLPTNCFIKTKNNYYNFFLTFKKYPSKQTFIINDRSGILNNGLSKPITEENKLKANNPRNEKINKVLKLSKPFKPATSYNSDVIMSFQGAFYDGKLLYYKFLLDNNSDLTYTTGEFFTTIRKQKKRNSAENERPIYSKEIIDPGVIKGKSKAFIIFIFDQFSVNRKEELVFEFKEGNNGQRDFTLRLPSFVVNKPDKID